MLEKIAGHLTKSPLRTLTVTAVIFVMSVVGFLSTRVNYDILTYLPEDLESTQGIAILEDPFRMAATTMLVVDDMPAAYTNELVDEIKDVPGVNDVVWLSSMVGIQLPKEMLPAQLRDVFYSNRGTMLLIMYDKAAASEETMQAISSIRKLCNQKCFLSGLSAMVRDTRDLINREMPRYVGLAVLLSIAAMMLTLDSYVLPFVLILNIGLAVVFNFGSNVFLGQISYITQAIAAILQLGVTMDYSIFLYDRYMEECRKTEDKKEAMAQAVMAAFRSLAGSSLTTVAGFLALCCMQLTLGRDIGIVMAKGVVIGIITVITVLPSLILLADKYIEKTRHKPFLPDFTAFNRGILKLRYVLVLAGVLLIPAAIYSQNHVSMYYKIDESLPADMPSKVASRKLSEEYNMVSSHYVILGDGLSDTEQTEMENRIREVKGVTDVFSCHSLLGTGIPDFFVPEAVKNMLKNDGHQLMMINSKYEVATDELAEQITELRGIIKAADPDALLTGEGVMTKDLIDVTAVDFKMTNYISVAAIFVIIAILFKSLSVPLLLVAVIELAICINQGVPYFTGTEVAFVAPTVISAIQLGATVDYAILMTTRFEEELKKGADRREAILTAARSSDPSIITSALVMFCATIGVSFICTIDMVSAICIMLARGAVISAVISIVLLPSVLYLFEPLIRHTTIGWKRAKKGEKS